MSLCGIFQPATFFFDQLNSAGICWDVVLPLLHVDMTQWVMQIMVVWTISGGSSFTKDLGRFVCYPAFFGGRYSTRGVILQCTVIPYHIFPTKWAAKELLRVSHFGHFLWKGIRKAINTVNWWFLIYNLDWRSVQTSPQLFFCFLVACSVDCHAELLKKHIISWCEKCIKQFQMIMLWFPALLGCSLRRVRWLYLASIFKDLESLKIMTQTPGWTSYWASLGNIQATSRIEGS